MSQEIAYYFEKLEKFPLPDLLDGLETPADILRAVKPALDARAKACAGVENHGVLKGDAVHIHGYCHIGEGTVIYEDVTIIGPVYIGKNCEIMPGALLRPYTVLGDGCAVGHGSELKHAVLFGGAKVSSLAFVGNSVLGASARVGSGVITGNRKFNQGGITVKMDGVRHDLGDTYFGVVLGDAARLGANAVTQPGTHIGPYTWIYPMTAVRGFIPRQKRVYHPRELAFEENEMLELKP